ncbi:4-trimethylaminobutyraldehyde dehydrogenase [Cichlidogyrus casuarinus]|uniref:Small ribosomal subunit protein mS29 n=1 Tax=Cichlidogyrus casuarinus TaxID=1844966 RepID=A0ABD2QF86_9PLAT
MLAQYALESDALLFNFHDAQSWIKRKRKPDYTEANDYHRAQHIDRVKEDIYDFPERSQSWLKNFLLANKSVLEKHDLKLKKQVDWTRKDFSPVGTPWLEIINFGIERIKYANDIIGILLREARLSSIENDIPFYLMIDGVNFLWIRSTIMMDHNTRKLIGIDRFSIVHHLKRALCADWTKGAVICSTNPRCSWPTDREEYNPGYLLTKEGFEYLDPFIPVKVNPITETELLAMMSFYSNNKWLTKPEAFTQEGLNQIRFISDGNMRELFSLVAEW